MTQRLLITIAIILLATAPSQGQTTEGVKTPAQRQPKPLTPDEFEPQWNAYQAAMKIAEPEKRLAALQQLLKDFPENPPVDMVERGALETYIKFRPQETAQILARIDTVIGRLPTGTRGSVTSNRYHEIAAQLLAAGILLDKAEELLATAIPQLDEKQFANRERMRAKATQSTPPSDEEIGRKFRAERARLLTTLARIHLKRGRPVEAEKLLKEAFAANTMIMEANTTLAELALNASDDAAALEYLTAAALSGRLPQEHRSQLETVYRKTHKGSLAGLEETLTSRYRALAPNPIKVERYRPTPARADRAALAEIFTGAACVPCVSAELVFEAALERYSPRELAVLMYHVHIPSPDPMANPSTLAREKFYDVGSAPTIVIDGVKEGKGGGPREMAQRVYARIEPLLEKRMETMAEARIRLKATLEGDLVKVRATVDQVKGASRELKLHLALAEDDVYYIGENRVRAHSMVVRNLAGAAGDGFAFDSSKPATIEHTFSLAKISAEIKAYLDEYETQNRDDNPAFAEKKYKIDAGKISVVAFVQDEKSKQVLQAGFLKPEAGRTVRQ